LLEQLPAAAVEAMRAMPPESVWVLMLLLCFGSVVALYRLFGEAGLIAYIVLAILGANIQVLKPVQFSLFNAPIPLGTVLFASSYLCTDILAEHFGKAAARRAVLIGFAAYLFWTVLMVVTLGFAPLTAAQAEPDFTWALANDGAMATLFTPAPMLFVAGMTAYLISQFHDIWLYTLIRKLTRGRALWLRNNLSTWVSALIDNTVFSLLAWIVLAADPLPLDIVVWDFIIGTYLIRLVVAVLDTPFVYLARGVGGGRAASHA